MKRNLQMNEIKEIALVIRNKIKERLKSEPNHEFCDFGFRGVSSKDLTVAEAYKLVTS